MKADQLGAHRQVGDDGEGDDEEGMRWKGSGWILNTFQK